MINKKSIWLNAYKKVLKEEYNKKYQLNVLKKLCKIYNYDFKTVKNTINKDFEILDAILEIIFQNYAPLENEEIDISIEAVNIVDFVKKCINEKIEKDFIETLAYIYITDLDIEKKDNDILSILIFALITSL